MNAAHWYALNWFDYSIIGLIVLSAGMSFCRGFIRETVSLCVWGLGIYLGFRFATPLSMKLPFLAHLPVLQYVAAFMMIFVGVWIAGMLLQFLLRPLVAAAGFGLADRLLGFCLGALRGGLLVAVLLLFVKVSPFEQSQTVQTAHLVPHFNGAVNWLDHFAMRFRSQ